MSVQKQWMAHFLCICKNENKSICRKKGRGRPSLPPYVARYYPCEQRRELHRKIYVYRVQFPFIFTPLNPVSNSLVFGFRNKNWRNHNYYCEWCHTLTCFSSKLSPKFLRLWWNENSMKEKVHRTQSKNDQGANPVTLETQGLFHVWDK